MTTKRIDGKALSQKMRQQIKTEVDELKAKGIVPGLAVIIVGDDPASRTYVNNKKKDCAEVGITSVEYALPASSTEKDIKTIVEKLNADKNVNGILCQLPLPAGIDETDVIHTILPEKDVDAFHPVNVGKILLGGGDFLPCTPAGIMEMLHSEGIEVCGKKCVVIGRSNIVGKPMALMLLRENGTVEICHSHTADLKKETLTADILVSAVGRTKFVTADMVKEGAVVIDVGMNRDENGKLCGDVDFDGVDGKASFLTPVPGGVGPMTRVMLLVNTLTAVKKQNGLR